MTSSIIAECGHRDRKQQIKDGECRDCRGVEKRERLGSYIPQKERLEGAERLAHTEQENRSHIINNDR